MSRPSILDVAAEIQRVTGKVPLTPRWEAVARVTYGLDLRDVDVDNLSASTKRSKGQLRAMAGSLGVGRRRFNELWARVGRRGRKSFTMALIAVYEAAFGGHERYLVAGERGLVAIISKDIAGSTIVANFCEIHAQALGFETSWTNMGAVRILELAGIPFGIACFPCNGKAPRGFAIPVIVLDEPAHWATELGYSGSDETVIGAAKPAMAQFPDSLLLAISSPLGMSGVFHETVEANLGDDAQAGVFAVEGPTWEWNPEISEARTHELERNVRTHKREYGGVPQEGALSVFEVEWVDRAIVPRTGGEPGRRVIVLDPSSGRKDAWTWAVVGWNFANGGGVLPWLTVDLVDGVSSGFFSTITSDKIVARVAKLARELGIKSVHSDQREAFALQSAFAREGLAFTAHDWTSSSKPEAVERVRRWFADGRIVLPKHDVLRRELLSFEERITPSGALTFGARGAGHDDYVALLLTASMAIGDQESMRPDEMERAFRINDRLLGGPLPGNEPPHKPGFFRNSRWETSRGRGFG